MPESVEAAIVGGGMLCFSVGMAHTIYHSRRRLWQTVLCWIFNISVTIALWTVLYPCLGFCSGAVAGLILIGAYVYLFDVPIRQRLLIFFFVNTTMYAMAMAARYTFLMLDTICPIQLPELVFVLLYLGYTGIFLCIYLIRLRTSMLRWLTRFGAYFSGSAIFAAAGYFLLPLLFNGGDATDGICFTEFAEGMLFLLLLALGYSLAFFNMAAVWETEEARRQTERVSEMLKQSEQYYETLTVHQQKIRRMQHDMRHHFRVLESCLRNGQYARMADYLEDLQESIPDHMEPALCANYTASILLRYYADRAGAEGIRFTCDAQIPQTLSISDSHLSVVFGNALQNALEACLRQPSGEDRYMELLARVHNDFLILEVTNSFDGSMAYDQDGQIKSGKSESGHGLGLESVADIARQYHGYYCARPEGHRFLLRVVLACV